MTIFPQVKLMFDASQPPNKIAKVSNHLKQLAQSDGKDVLYLKSKKEINFTISWSCHLKTFWNGLKWFN